MGGVVELCCNGISLEKSKCSGQTFCSKLKRTSGWFGEPKDSAIKAAKLCRHEKERAEF
jgi:hypothetical protein